MYWLESRGTLVLPSEKVSSLIAEVGRENDHFKSVKETALASKENLCFLNTPGISFEINGNRVEVIIEGKTEFLHESIKRLMDMIYSVLRDLAFSVMDGDEFDESKSFVVIRDIAITGVKKEG